jgi:DNA-directed RNA polymerase specialized sigma24 family protein
MDRPHLQKVAIRWGTMIDTMKPKLHKNNDVATDSDKDTSDEPGSVTRVIQLAQLGESDAVRHLSHRYYNMISELAATMIIGRAKHVVGGDDIANNVLHLFFDGARRGRFLGIQNRDDFWSLLSMMAARKAISEMRKATAKKRGGNRVKTESEFPSLQSSEEEQITFDINQIPDKIALPELQSLMREQHSLLINELGGDAKREVVDLRLRGYKDQEIADKLRVSKRYVEEIMATARNILKRHVERDLRH